MKFSDHLFYLLTSHNALAMVTFHSKMAIVAIQYISIQPSSYRVLNTANELDWL